MARKRKTPPAAARDYLPDVYGVAVITIALVLGISAVTSSSGLIGDYLQVGLKWIVGGGRYFLPIFLLVWGASFFINSPRSSPESAGLGLLMCFLSLVSLDHLFLTEPSSTFAEASLFRYGGILGAAFSYTFRLFFGKPIATIVFAALFITGSLVATGVSFSDVLSRMRWRRQSVEGRSKERSSVKRVRQEAPTVKLSDVQVVEQLEELEARVGPESDAKPVEVQEESDYQFPPLSMLKRTTPGRASAKRQDVRENARIIEATLKEFEVAAIVERVVRGPTVTRYEIQLGAGVKVNRVSNLADDIALALATADVRMLAPIPGKSAVGIEVPNKNRELVTLGDILATKTAQTWPGSLVVGVGKEITGQPVLANLEEMPHLLIAGATGSGKSVYLNSLLVSMLTRARPDSVKMILIDPKRIELNLFDGIPHLMVPVVTDAKQAANVLAWAVSEMESRFRILADAKVRNIQAYDKYRKKKPSAPKIPFLLIVIDELADLMLVAPGDVEDAICRLAQLARAVGIHLVVATQRPSVDIITGVIKANITSRIAFAVSSQTDSRVVMDVAGAEKLVGKGDMLFIAPGSLRPRRIQGALVTESEINETVEFTKAQAKPEYILDILEDRRDDIDLNYDDEMLDKAIDVVVNAGQASATLLQRRLRLGYARAARLIDILEHRGVVGGFEGSKPRAVLITPEELGKMKTKADQPSSHA